MASGLGCPVVEAHPTSEVNHEQSDPGHRGSLSLFLPSMIGRIFPPRITVRFLNGALPLLGKVEPSRPAPYLIWTANSSLPTHATAQPLSAGPRGGTSKNTGLRCPGTMWLWDSPERINWVLNPGEYKPNAS